MGTAGGAPPRLAVDARALTSAFTLSRASARAWVMASLFAVSKSGVTFVSVTAAIASAVAVVIAIAVAAAAAAAAASAASALAFAFAAAARACADVISASI